jgi:hypothetical protein
MSERRKETRKKLMAFTPVYNLPQRRLLGYLHDLTLQGAMVICTRPDEVNRKETLLIEFPDQLTNMLVSQMTLQARVARCTVDAEDPQGYLVGFEFLELTPENQAAIRALLERYHFRHQLEEQELPSRDGRDPA